MAFNTININLCILILSVLSRRSSSFLISPAVVQVAQNNARQRPFLELSTTTDAISSRSSNPQEGHTLSWDNEIDNDLTDLALKPPELLRKLELGASLHVPSSPVEIIRVGVTPDIFLLRNFLPHDSDRKALIQEAIVSGLEDAETKSGTVLHRTKSSVAWIHNFEDLEELSEGQNIASFMKDFVSQFFLSEMLLESDRFEPESLQVARYTQGGKYDFHHDGFGRVVTVLSYLNGVAGTWFPFAKLSQLTAADNKEFPPKMTLEGTGMAEGKVPGKHGIWVVGEEYEGDTTDPHIVKVCAGDAVVIYNYEFDVDYGAPVMTWRSIHAGMPTSREKWIATNWVHSDLGDQCSTGRSTNTR